MAESKTLLEKYDIPLSHLDFTYVEKCENAREMEKIVKILRSGEEGFYPDLTRCAEEKLKKLKPESRLFRYEEQISSTNILDKSELKPIYDWNHEIKTKDNALMELNQDNPDLADLAPPVRKPCKIEIDKEETVEMELKPAITNPKPVLKANQQRIKSTDYGKWDKYDPDEEILRMDLEEERTKEQIQIESHKTQKSTKEQLKDIKQPAELKRLHDLLQNLSSIEREQYAERFRLKGNEHFKSKEYDNAIYEYTRAIVYNPEHAANAYNNRAISYIKKGNFVQAIEDCDACLKLEPNNIKALLRLAEANNAQGQRRESYNIYELILNLEPENPIAKKALDQLQSQLGELAPAHATRMIIEELPPENKTEKEKPMAQPKPVAKVMPAQDYDLAELVKPNRIVKSKFVTAAEALGGQLKGQNNQASSLEPQRSKQQHQPLLLQDIAQEDPVLLMPPNENSKNNKLLIQEI